MDTTGNDKSDGVKKLQSVAHAASSDVPPKKRKPSADSSQASSSHVGQEDARALPKRRKASIDTSERKPSVDLSSGASSNHKISFELPTSRKSSIGSDDILMGRRKGSGGSSKDMSRRRKSSIDSAEHSSGLAALGSVASSTLSEERATGFRRHNTSADGVSKGSGASGKALEHLDALGDEQISLNSRVRAKRDEDGSGSAGTLGSANQRILMEALMISGTHQRRDRFESWGGMSDLSLTGMRDDFASSDAAVASFAASALHETGILGDVVAAATSCNASVTSEISEDAGQKASVPSRISVSADQMSDQNNSATGLSDIMNTNCPELQAHLQAAMMAADLAASGRLEGVVRPSGSLGSLGSDTLRREAGIDSDISSSASPLIRAMNEKDVAMLKKLDAAVGRTRSSSTSSRPITSDYVDEDAVAAAVAATNSLLDSSFATVLGSKKLSAKPSVSPSESKRLDAVLSKQPPESAMSSEELDARRARARAAAGYVPPSGDDMVTSRQPIKKRPKIPTPDKSLSQYPFSAPPEPQCSPGARPSAPEASHTPQTSNATRGRLGRPLPRAPVPLSALSSAAASNTKDSANQKWEEMYNCLLQFVHDCNAHGPEKTESRWDGNVPTGYKTKDGKALGRWINNQRTAKSRGTLKEEREKKLVSTGLRWSVLTTNAWDDMLKELELYVAQQTKGGQEWDGNVPTNYLVSGDRKLGRWVNRQRSLYQSGKLLDERIDKLEEIGLRWSVLNNTSWDGMYDALVEYVKERKSVDPNHVWDGNCPAKYETRDGKALGRWINRQRSNYTKDKLKKQYRDKLTSLGLKWAVHDRRMAPNAGSSLCPDGDENQHENQGVDSVEV